MRFNTIIESAKNVGFNVIEAVKDTNFLQENKEGLIIGFIVATGVFILKENKKVKDLLNGIKYRSKNSELQDRVNKAMKEHNVDFDRAKQIIITEELLNGLRVSKPSWFLKDDRLVYQGQRISFHDKEVGYVKGDFLGIINPDVDGYDDLYVVRLIKDNSIRQAPISFVEEDTINVYS